MDERQSQGRSGRPGSRPGSQPDSQPDRRKGCARVVPRVRPATDILEREDGFYIYMDMPGVSRENLVLDIRENELTVSGKTNYDPGTGGRERFLEVEFGNGEYYRVFTLSEVVDKERIKAHLSGGVLEIHMPRVEKAQPRRIEVQTE